MNTRFLETDVRKEGLHQRLLQLPILPLGRGTAPQRAVEEILGQMAKLAIVQLVKDGYGVAANAARQACARYCAQVDRRYIKPLG